MDTLVSLAVTASFIWSVYALLFEGAGTAGVRLPFAFTFSAVNGQTLYFEAAAGVTTAVIAGRYLEARAKHRAASALTALAALGVKSVAVLRDGGEQRVPAVELAAGDPVTGATVNMSGRLVVRATCAGAGTLLAQVTRLVTQAQASKASAQRLADRIVAVFVPCVISLAVVTFGFWLGSGLPAAQAWSSAVAVLVVAARARSAWPPRRARRRRRPRRRARPAGQERTGALGGQAGPGRRAGQDGTLTAGTMAVTAVITDPAPDCVDGNPGSPADEALVLAGAVEDASEHPVGQAIAREAAARFGGLPAVTRFVALPRAGVSGRAGGLDITVGSRVLFAELSLEIAATLDAAVTVAENRGQPTR